MMCVGLQCYSESIRPCIETDLVERLVSSSFLKFDALNSLVDNEELKARALSFVLVQALLLA